jgi:3-isopropylmalate dehydratase small subunit
MGGTSALAYTRELAALSLGGIGIRPTASISFATIMMENDHKRS